MGRRGCGSIKCWSLHLTFWLAGGAREFHQHEVPQQQGEQLPKAVLSWLRQPDRLNSANEELRRVSAQTHTFTALKFLQERRNIVKHFIQSNLQLILNIQSIDSGDPWNLTNQFASSIMSWIFNTVASWNTTHPSLSFRRRQLLLSIIENFSNGLKESKCTKLQMGRTWHGQAHWWAVHLW